MDQIKPFGDPAVSLTVDCDSLPSAGAVVRLRVVADGYEEYAVDTVLTPKEAGRLSGLLAAYALQADAENIAADAERAQKPLFDGQPS
ncbi:hypothetical protein [Methyloversatilis discipulorum]|uniref:hypothetical protein n=1 Tax=Methyloversatilis discipulorum TaxID=1119528 RepID=UPI003F680241